MDADLICQTCRKPDHFPEYVVNGTLFVCSGCKAMFSSYIFCVCLHCGGRGWIPKHAGNIQKIQGFLRTTTLAHFMASDVIVPFGGCPNCVSFDFNVLGERRPMVSEMEPGLADWDG